MRELDYLVYDVFTETPLAGNPLGVVPDASGLSGPQMQAIARELNLSETIFFLPPVNPAHAAKVRIFMPLGELPFAGHPTIGGAVAYAGLKTLSEKALVILEEGVGPVHCEVSADTMSGHAVFNTPRIPAELEFKSGQDDVAAALGLSREDLDFDLHHVLMVSAGVPYVTVPVKSVEVLARARVDADVWLKLDVAREGKYAAPYIYCRDSSSAFRARLFAPWDGIAEDPATGSAAAAFAASLARFRCKTDGNHALTIRQGVEMGRPSDIGLTLTIEQGRLSKVAISGDAVKIAAGKLFLPV